MPAKDRVSHKKIRMNTTAENPSRLINRKEGKNRKVSRREWPIAGLQLSAKFHCLSRFGCSTFERNFLGKTDHGVSHRSRFQRRGVRCSKMLMQRLMRSCFALSWSPKSGGYGNMPFLVAQGWIS